MRKPKHPPRTRRARPLLIAGAALITGAVALPGCGSGNPGKPPPVDMYHYPDFNTFAPDYGVPPNDGGNFFQDLGPAVNDGGTEDG